MENIKLYVKLVSLLCKNAANTQYGMHRSDRDRVTQRKRIEPVVVNMNAESGKIAKWRLHTRPKDQKQHKKHEISKH